MCVCVCVLISELILDKLKLKWALISQYNKVRGSLVIRFFTIITFVYYKNVYSLELILSSAMPHWVMV